MQQTKHPLTRGSARTCSIFLSAWEQNCKKRVWSTYSPGLAFTFAPPWSRPILSRFHGNQIRKLSSSSGLGPSTSIGGGTNVASSSATSKKIICGRFIITVRWQILMRLKDSNNQFISTKSNKQFTCYILSNFYKLRWTSTPFLSHCSLNEVSLL